MLTLFVRDLPGPLIIPESLATRCLDCGIVYRLARTCPACDRDSGALLDGSWWRRWRSRQRESV